MADPHEFGDGEGDGLSVPSWAYAVFSVEVGGVTAVIQCPNSEDTPWRDVPDRPTAQRDADAAWGRTESVTPSRPVGTDGPATSGAGTSPPEEPKQDDPRREDPDGPAAGTQRSRDRAGIPPGDDTTGPGKGEHR